MTLMTLDHITSVLLAFNADIYGEHLWNSLQTAQNTKTDIECRVDPWLISTLKNVLSITNRVTEIHVKRPHYTWDVHDRVIRILGRSIKELDGTASCHLDVMLLAMSRNSLYVRLAYDAFDQHPEVNSRGQITHLVDRIKNKRFCLLPGALDSSDAMKRAWDLVEKGGWTMDNMIVPNSWIISRADDGDHGECAICKDDMMMNDTVITLHCGHSFHAKCIYSWFQDHGKRTCPMCRVSVV
jgi:hypothetical protein